MCAVPVSEIYLGSVGVFSPVMKNTSLMKNTQTFQSKTFKWSLVAILALFTLSACERQALDLPRKRRAGEVGRQSRNDVRPSIFGEGGLDLSGTKKASNANTGGGLGVNSYLWRATLDTIAFMPLSSADPFGGVVITDWFSPPETPKERFKVNILIKDRALRADGIRVSLFRQVKDQTGWTDATVQKNANRKMEDAILTRARQLRNETRNLGK